MRMMDDVIGMRIKMFGLQIFYLCSKQIERETKNRIPHCISTFWFSESVINHGRKVYMFERKDNMMKMRIEYFYYRSRHHFQLICNNVE